MCDKRRKSNSDSFSIKREYNYSFKLRLWVITPWHEILHGVVIPLRQRTVWYDSLSDDEILALVLFDREASTVKCKWEDGEKQTNRNLLPACYFTTVTVRMIPVKHEWHRAASESKQILIRNRRTRPEARDSRNNEVWRSRRVSVWL